MVEDARDDLDEDEDSGDEDEIVEETPFIPTPKGGWKGPLDKKNKGNYSAPGELLKHFRWVWRGRVPPKFENDPGIASIRMLKLENNEKFLAELRTLEKAHDEKVARRRADAAKKQEAERAAAPPPAAKDQTTEDLVALVSDLLAEFCKA